MINTKTISKEITSYNIKKYINFDSNITIGDIIELPIDLLPKGSHEKIDVKCDCCGIEKSIYYFSYNKIIDKYDKYLCNKCVITERNKTNIEKYGTPNPIILDVFQNKRKKTLKENYGDENYNNIEKRYNTNILKYNTKHATQSKIVRDKITKTCLDIYGSVSSLGNKAVREKAKNTMKEKYGHEYTFQIDKYKKQIRYKYLLYLKKKQQQQFKDILDINYENNIYLCKCDKCGKTYEIDSHLFIQRKKSYDIDTCIFCNPIGKKYSGLEVELDNFIQLIINTEIIINSRYIIKPYELDIYLPDLKIAFEFNGLYWHNELNKSNNYHNIKTNLCNDIGIQLIHIYEDDWLYKQDIVKSMILNKLNKTPDKIYARKTEVKEITDNKLIRDFLEKNHIQGFVGSSIKIGLYHKDELISLMTFGKKRKNMNSKSENENEYEMLRFCNKLNTNIIGGASKLFKYFLRNYVPMEIISYADRSYSNGNLYNQLGFTFSHITEPNYYYIIDRKRYNRYNFRKDVLVKEGYNSNKTEHEIMLKRKIYRIYNSGNYKFILNFR